MNRLADVLQKYESEILADWMKDQLAAIRRRDLISDTELREQSTAFLREIAKASASGGVDPAAAPWAGVRSMLGEVSASRATQGFSPAETAVFVLSLKQAVMKRLRKEAGNDADTLFEEIWNSSLLIDRLALYTTDAFIRAKEQMVVRQQEEMLELSTPVVKLWDGILALPMIGTLDSSRTQVVMESLLQKVVDTGAQIAILDITGVPTVDTLVAQHLLKTVTALRLMGAECIISGVRPQIAQTIVHLGVDLNAVTTKATLADAFAVALQRTGQMVARNGGPSGAAAGGAAAPLTVTGA